MRYISRSIESIIQNTLREGKVLILLGARRVGKTELIKHQLSQLKKEEKVLLLHGESEDTHDLLRKRTIQNYQRVLGNTTLLIIDEAQAIPEIGLKLKLMIDHIHGLKIMVTGSSVFDLNNQLGEPLVGRKTTLKLHPMSQIELSKEENYPETHTKLEERLILGAYPELEHLESRQQKIQYLKEIIDAYLLKDILVFEGIKKRNKVIDLLRIIAFRIGSEISLESIGNDLNISKNTVDRYLDLLSKVFIIYNLKGFSRNLDNEITKKGKWYFYDNGIRNALINSFNTLAVRDDHGQLWENYLIAERLKKQEYKQIYSSNFFWRTHTQQEIDWVEERGGKLFAFEFKWKKSKKSKIPPAWKKGYPDTDFETITPDNYLDFIT